MMSITSLIILSRVSIIVKMLATVDKNITSSLCYVPRQYKRGYPKTLISNKKAQQNYCYALIPFKIEY